MGRKVYYKSFSAGIILYAPLFLFARFTLNKMTVTNSEIYTYSLVNDVFGLFLIVLFTCLFTPNFSRYFQFILYIPLSILFLGLIKNIQANGWLFGFMELSELINPTFLKGSVFPNMPILIPVVLMAWLIFNIIFVKTKRRVSGLNGKYRVLLFLFFLFLIPVMSKSDHRFDRFAQVNILVSLGHDIIQQVKLTTIGVKKEKSSSFSSIQLSPEVNQPWIGPERSIAKNVLLIVIESLPGNSIFPRPQFSKSMILNQVRNFALSNMSWSHFLALNRKTDKGLWGLLCGQLPMTLNGHISQLKAIQQIKSLGVTCLPEVLKRNNYNTYYFQSAELSYMNKDDFMPAFGFDHTLGGSQWIKKPVHKTEWGPGDEDFFKNAFNEIQKINNKKQPWFATLLNVGTHHPFQVPQFWTPSGKGDIERSFKYMEEYLIKFLKMIQSTNIDRNTLIVITADESIGLKQDQIPDELYKNYPRYDRLMSQSWIPLIISEPNGKAFESKATFIQSDLPTSILDYLNIPNHSYFGGRSLFRKYKKSRDIVFGNVHSGRVYYFSKDNVLSDCNRNLQDCSSFYIPDGKFLWHQGTKISNPVRKIEQLKSDLYKYDSALAFD